MRLLFRTARKEYDGPAVAPTTHHGTRKPQLQQNPKNSSNETQHKSKCGRHVDDGSTMSQEKIDGKVIYCTPNVGGSVGSTISGTLPGRRRGNSNQGPYGARRRHSGPDPNVAVPLPSGESTRRRSSTPSIATVGQVSKRPSDSTENLPNLLDSSERSNRSGATHLTPQTPMEHDGGILCVTPVPTTDVNNNNDRRRNKFDGGFDGGKTHRFLSGGIDGAVKLWEVYEPPNSRYLDSRDPLTPRLVKTYKGHKGYVHSIAVLGSFDPFEGVKFDSTIPHEGDDDEQSLYSNNDSSSSKSEESRKRNNSNNLNRFSRKNTNGSGGNNAHSKLDAELQRQKALQKQLKRWGGRRKKDLFVTASRDNTLRIWEIENYNENDAYFEDGEDSNSTGGRSTGASPILATGKKLRGHEFGTNAAGGVLCVCAVPSNKASKKDGNNSAGEDSGVGKTVSAGQFASGGSDGVVRIWDVRSALFSIGKVPKAGMYGTVCIQSLHPIPIMSGAASNTRKGKSSKEQPTVSRPVPITSIICSQGDDGSGEYGLFAADANGTIRRYSPMNECGDGHVNGAIWWGCTGIFHGHRSTISSLSLISSPNLMPALTPSSGPDKHSGKIGTMLLSSSNDGSIRIWDAFDMRIKAKLAHLSDEKKSMLQRVHLREIELNEKKRTQDNGSRPSMANVALDGCVGVTSLVSLGNGNLMAAGTTDGAVRLWNVATGLYEGAYNVGKSVQVWSLAVLAEEDMGETEDGDVQSISMLVSGDNRGRIRILKKISTRRAVRGDVYSEPISHPRSEQVVSRPSRERQDNKAKRDRIKEEPDDISRSSGYSLVREEEVPRDANLIPVEEFNRENDPYGEKGQRASFAGSNTSLPMAWY
ncbi:hypothetical protein ACHAXS_003910 [Conticribra weissflogii]